MCAGLPSLFLAPPIDEIQSPTPTGNLNMRTLMPVIPLLLIATTAGAEPPANPADEAQALVKQFAGTLKGELKAALAEGGPEAAVGVCHERAPAIAESLSAQSGWSVGRTSLKTRNGALNSPDAWETKVLEAFEQRAAAGEPVGPMRFDEVVEVDGQKTYRFMKAIPTDQVCLACHGSDIPPEVAAAIDKAYPDDQARGFAIGDIRGAFTLSKPL
jgi:hypothetical protein